MHLVAEHRRAEVPDDDVGLLGGPPPRMILACRCPVSSDATACRVLGVRAALRRCYLDGLAGQGGVPVIEPPLGVGTFCCAVESLRVPFWFQ